VFPALGGIPGQVEIEKLIRTLKIKNADDLHLSNLFLIFSLEVRKKKTLKLNIDFFSPPLTCASCLGGIKPGQVEIEKARWALKDKLFRRGSCRLLQFGKWDRFRTL